MAGRQPSTSLRVLRARRDPVVRSILLGLSVVPGAAVVPQPSAAFAPTHRADVLAATLRTGLRAVALAPAGTSSSVLRADTMPVPADTAHVDRDETTAAAADTRSKVTVYRADSPRNVEVGLRLRPTSANARGGVALRLLTPTDYYVVQVDARNETVVFARVSHGRSKTIASVESDIGANAWHTLHVRAQDNRFTVILDGKWLFTAYDAGLSRPGHVALWSSTDSPVEFDGISVKPLGPE